MSSRSPKTGVVTKTDGNQFIEEKLTASERLEKSDEVAKLIMDRAKLNKQILVKTSEFKEEKRKMIERREKLESRMEVLGYEVHEKVKRVPRQQSLLPPEKKPAANGAAAETE